MHAVCVNLKTIANNCLISHCNLILMLLPEIKIYAKSTPAQLIEDYSRNILFCNQAFVELFDIDKFPDELVGTNCIDLLISISNSIPEIEDLSAFVAKSLAERLPAKIDNIKINSTTIISITYRSVKLKENLPVHIWEYTVMS